MADISRKQWTGLSDLCLSKAKKIIDAEADPTVDKLNDFISDLALVISIIAIILNIIVLIQHFGG